MGLNPRLQGLIHREPNYLVYHPAGIRLYGPDADERLNAMLERADRAAGRELTLRELMKGASRAEDRSREQRARDEIQITQAQHSGERPDLGDVAGQMLHGGRVLDWKGNPIPKSREAHLREQSKLYQEQQRDKLAKAEDLAQRAPTLNHAAEQFLAVFYDSSAPQSELHSARKRVELAETDTEAYRAEDRLYRERRAVKLAEREREVDSHIAALKASKSDLDSGAYDPPAPIVRKHSDYVFQDEATRAGREATLGVKDE